MTQGNGQPISRPWQPDARVFLAVDNPNVVIETVKQAEDGDGVIVRLYESRRTRGPVMLKAGCPVSAAGRTNLLEENQESLAVHGADITFDIQPYQIVTLRIAG